MCMCVCGVGEGGGASSSSSITAWRKSRSGVAFLSGLLIFLEADTVVNEASSLMES